MKQDTREDRAWSFMDWKELEFTAGFSQKCKAGLYKIKMLVAFGPI